MDGISLRWKIDPQRPCEAPNGRKASPRKRRTSTLKEASRSEHSRMSSLLCDVGIVVERDSSFPCKGSDGVVRGKAIVEMSRGVVETRFNDAPC